LRFVLAFGSLLAITGCNPGSVDSRPETDSASTTELTTTVVPSEKRIADGTPLSTSPATNPLPVTASEPPQSLDPSVMRYLRCIDIDCAETLRDVVAVGPALTPQLLQLLRQGLAPELAAEMPGNAARATGLKVVAALGAMNDPRAIDPLAGELKNPDPLLRAEVVRALGGFRENSRALSAVLPLLRDPDPLVREVTVESLRRIGGVAAATALRQALEAEPADYIREAMAKAIRMLEAR